jgi:hypothetical protein
MDRTGSMHDYSSNIAVSRAQTLVGRLGTHAALASETDAPKHHSGAPGEPKLKMRSMYAGFEINSGFAKEGGIEVPLACHLVMVSHRTVLFGCRIIGSKFLRDNKPPHYREEIHGRFGKWHRTRLFLGQQENSLLIRFSARRPSSIVS